MVKAYLLHFLTMVKTLYSRCTVTKVPLTSEPYTGFIPRVHDSTIISALSVVAYLKEVAWENMSPKELSKLVFVNCRFITIVDIIDRLQLDRKALYWVDNTLRPNMVVPETMSLYQLVSSDDTYNRSRNATLIKLMLSEFKRLGDAYKHHTVPDYVAARHNVSVIEDDLRDVANIMLSLRDKIDHK